MARHLQFGGGSTSSIVRGGAGNDTISFGEIITTTTITGGAGDDSLDFTAAFSGSKIVSGAGNDTFNFATAGQTSGSTAYFGSASGDDSIYFTTASGATASTVSGLLTIAVDSSLGATSAYNFSRSSGDSTTTITFDTSGAGSIYIQGGATGTAAGGNGTGIVGFVFTTVSTSTITDLG